MRSESGRIGLTVLTIGAFVALILGSLFWLALCGMRGIE